ncbi:MAG: molybdate ABC transporter permease subunit [Rhizobiaceae bacterium]|nr:molybdate ABC transporter permease subunit [Rhizobiaceae bacterium]
MSLLSPEYLEIVLLSLKVAGLAVIMAIGPAIFMAYALANWSFPGKSILNALAHIPLVMPPVVTGYLLLIVMGPKGSVGIFLSDWFGVSFGFRWTGAALAAAVMAFPLMMRPMRLAFESIDGNLTNIASTLGAGKWTTFFTISLPLALPGILAGLVLGFAKALGEFGATITFVSNIPGETQTISLAVYSLLQSPNGDAQALILIVTAIAISFAALLLSDWFSEKLMRKRGGDDG